MARGIWTRLAAQLRSKEFRDYLRRFVLARSAPGTVATDRGRATQHGTRLMVPAGRPGGWVAGDSLARTQS